MEAMERIKERMVIKWQSRNNVQHGKVNIGIPNLTNSSIERQRFFQNLFCERQGEREGWRRVSGVYGLSGTFVSSGKNPDVKKYERRDKSKIEEKKY